jgi:hypothetical protein
MGRKGNASDTDRFNRIAVARQAIERLQKIAGGVNRRDTDAPGALQVFQWRHAWRLSYIERNFPTEAQFAQQADINAKTLSRLFEQAHRVSKTTWALVTAAMGIKLAELLRTGH